MGTALRPAGGWPIRRILAAAAAAAGLVLVAAAPARPAAATTTGDGPAGFWYGTDSATIAIGGSAPYREPVVGGSYGGYIGMTGNWARWQGCGGKVVFSTTNATQADTNYRTYHRGVGTGVYWFMGGPGVDPHYDGTAQEAYAWGRAQAQRAWYDVTHQAVRVTYPVLVMDVELPGDAPSYTPAPDNGWNSVYTSACSGRVAQSSVPARVDRATFNGFWDYVTDHTTFAPGVYSAPDVWGSIFAGTSYGDIPNTDEWTYAPATSSLSNPPYGWCLRGTSTCARFFGGVTSASPHALMWQWSGGGGFRNGYGDFDQIDAARHP